MGQGSAGLGWEVSGNPTREGKASPEPEWSRPLPRLRARVLCCLLRVPEDGRLSSPPWCLAWMLRFDHTCCWEHDASSSAGRVFTSVSVTASVGSGPADAELFTCKALSGSSFFLSSCNCLSMLSKHWEYYEGSGWFCEFILHSTLMEQQSMTGMVHNWSPEE